MKKENITLVLLNETKSVLFNEMHGKKKKETFNLPFNQVFGI